MFFSSDLLSKRDNGFGLLWLAATLGSKSAFKKLPKRSVMTADISQLCRLIAIPAEPLSLRLSSNLLVGAARVYRVKQEIFISDVTACLNALKRVEREFRSMTSSEGQLQMAQPSVKSSIVTLRADPWAKLSIDFDAMVTDWDEYLNNGDDKLESTEERHNEQNRPVQKTNEKASSASSLPANSEHVRATACTLPDNYDFFLANSFDASFGSSGATKISSSQIGEFSFDDTFDGLDIEGGLGDDLVRELGEGWGAIPIERAADTDLTLVQEPFAVNFDDEDLVGLDGLSQVTQDPQLHTPVNPIQSSQIGPAEVPSFPFSPSFMKSTNSVDFQNTVQVTGSSPAYVGLVQQDGDATLRKAKRIRPILDDRIELTNEELEATRNHYLDKQNTIRCELEIKRFEKQQVELIQTLLWDAPSSVHAEELISFWIERFKAHVETRSSFHVEPRDQDVVLPRKRLKLSASPHGPHSEDATDKFALNTESLYADQAPMEDVNFDYHMDVNWGEDNDHTPNQKNLRSSEEPGQARRTSHSPHIIGDDLGTAVMLGRFYSQRSALFPWDMTGNSSSISVPELGEIKHDGINTEHADVRLRGSSASRMGGSLHSVLGNLQSSSGVVLPAIQSDDDFVFDVPEDIHPHDPESQHSEVDRTALEKNSHNFLKYAKMQYRSLPSTFQHLAFDDVVPKATSTARVAAVALYHCLVLATRDLLKVKQEEPYGRIDMRVI